MHYQRQMVAVTVIVMIAEEETLGADTTVFRVFLNQERGIIDTARGHSVEQGLAHKNLVETAPLSTIAVYGLCTVASTGVFRYIPQVAMRINMAQGGIIGIVVEIAQGNDAGIGRKAANGVHGFHKSASHVQTIWACAKFATGTARSMDYKDVKGVAGYYFSGDIKDVARGPHVLYRADAQGIMAYKIKGKGRIEQGHIDAPEVGRVGHDILIMGLPQKGAPCEVAHHSVVLNLTQRHEVGQRPLA